MPGRKGLGSGSGVSQASSGLEAQGVLQFAGRPQDAPVLHFRSPWQVTLDHRQNLLVGRETDLFVVVGTRGHGTGTTTHVDYMGVIPHGMYPTVEVIYPPRPAHAAPPRQHYELKARC
jgi:hypothetical protein